MVCIYCNKKTQVINSRLQRRSNHIWRRRHCSACGSTFTTHEVPDYGTSIVVQYSTSVLQPFSRDLLFVSLYESLKHRKSALADATALCETITAQVVRKAENGVITREVIAQTAAEVLLRFDKTAATVYIAYHPS